MDIKTIGIAGAGTMGAGIAQVTAVSGYQTILFDVNENTLQKAKAATEKSLDMLVQKQKITTQKRDEAIQRIVYTNNIKQLTADLIIEAIVERLDVKQHFFAEVAAVNSAETILATNTSSIPVTQIAQSIPNPSRVLGIHFFNPAPIMKLVEIICGEETNPAIAQQCKLLIEQMGKTCVMAKDAPGFIVNRVARHFYVEGLKIAEEQVAGISIIDELMESSGFLQSKVNRFVRRVYTRQLNQSLERMLT